MMRRVELPQIEAPLLTREDPADEHNLDYVDKFELLVHQGLDAFLQSGYLSFIAPRQARLFPRREPRRGSGPELGGCDPFGVARLGDVKPPRFPPFQGSPQRSPQAIGRWLSCPPWRLRTPPGCC